MDKQRPIRVGVVSDVRLYREGIAESLSARDQFTVLGSAATLAGALALGEKLRGHILLLDVAMAEGLTIVRALSDTLPDLRTVGFALDEIEDDVVACAEAGIVGYVPRDASFDTLVEIIESASRDELVCSPRMASQLLRRLAVKPGSVGHPAEARLTRRERDVWQLLDGGLANKEIATELGIEVTTAKNHVHRAATLPSRQRRRHAAS